MDAVLVLGSLAKIERDQTQNLDQELLKRACHVIRIAAIFVQVLLRGAVTFDTSFPIIDVCPSPVDASLAHLATCWSAFARSASQLAHQSLDGAVNKWAWVSNEIIRPQQKVKSSGKGNDGSRHRRSPTPSRDTPRSQPFPLASSLPLPRPKRC